MRGLPYLLLTLVITASAAAQSELDDAPPAFAMGVDLPRPDPEGTTTLVTVGIYVIDITEMSDVSQSFTANFVVRIAWRDPRLAEAESGTRVFDRTQIWYPRVEVLNGRRLFPLWPDVVTVDAEGNAMYRQRYFGQLSCPLDLRDFPRDQQRLPFLLVVGGSRSDEVSIVAEKQMMGRSPHLTMAGLRVVGESFETGTLEILSGTLTMSRLEYGIDVSRESSYYRWKVFVPLCTIVLMAWASFWIDPKQVGPTVGIATTSVLTLIAYRFLLGHLVPPVPYLTRLDIFILLMTILVFTGLVIAVMTCNLATTGRERTARRIDIFSRVLYPLGFVVATAVSLAV